MGYNPLLEDLLESQEREAENEAAARRHKRDVGAKLDSMEQELFRKMAKDRQRIR